MSKDNIIDFARYYRYILLNTLYASIHIIDSVVQKTPSQTPSQSVSFTQHYLPTTIQLTLSPASRCCPLPNPHFRFGSSSRIEILFTELPRMRFIRTSTVSLFSTETTCENTAGEEIFCPSFILDHWSVTEDLSMPAT